MVEYRKPCSSPRPHVTGWSRSHGASRFFPRFDVVLLAAELAGTEDLGNLLSSSSSGSTTETSSRARLSLVQHGPMLRLLTGSHFGFLVLPALVALVTSSWCLCAIHMASYACAVGELTDLTLASSMHSLTFAPWQLGLQYRACEVWLEASCMLEKYR